MHDRIILKQISLLSVISKYMIYRLTSYTYVPRVMYVFCPVKEAIEWNVFKKAWYKDLRSDGGGAKQLRLVCRALANQCWGSLDRIWPMSLHASLNSEDLLPSLQKRRAIRLVAFWCHRLWESDVTYMRQQHTLALRCCNSNMEGKNLD